MVQKAIAQSNASTQTRHAVFALLTRITHLHKIDASAVAIAPNLAATTPAALKITVLEFVASCLVHDVPLSLPLPEILECAVDGYVKTSLAAMTVLLEYCKCNSVEDKLIDTITSRTAADVDAGVKCVAIQCIGVLLPRAEHLVSVLIDRLRNEPTRLAVLTVLTTTQVDLSLYCDVIIDECVRGLRHKQTAAASTLCLIALCTRYKIANYASVLDTCLALLVESHALPSLLDLVTAVIHSSNGHALSVVLERIPALLDIVNAAPHLFTGHSLDALFSALVLFKADPNALATSVLVCIF